VARFQIFLKKKKKPEQKIPEKEEKSHVPQQEEKAEQTEAVEEEVEEEKPEPDDELWEADPEPTQDMGGNGVEDVPDDVNSAAMELFSSARPLIQQRSFDEAISKLTEAIQKVPNKAIFFALRGEAFLKNKKPKAAIKDSDRALALNPNQAKAYKVRGKARRHLGDYEQASLDLNAGQKIDYDDDTQELLNSIKPRVEKIVLKKREAERKKAERELAEKKEKTPKSCRRKETERRKRKRRRRRRRVWWYAWNGWHARNGGHARNV